MTHPTIQKAREAHSALSSEYDLGSNCTPDPRPLLGDISDALDLAERLQQDNERLVKERDELKAVYDAAVAFRQAETGTVDLGFKWHKLLDALDEAAQKLALYDLNAESQRLNLE